jgi:hypothetical protein
MGRLAGGALPGAAAANQDELISCPFARQMIAEHYIFQNIALRGL